MPLIDRDTVRIHYETRGQGPVILLSHGYSATAQMWRGQHAALSQAHTLVTWDMRGHGQSDSPDDPAAYSAQATIDDMAAILDAVGAERAIIGGLSLGGYFSLMFHATYPARVRALLILDTGPGYRKDEARNGWNQQALQTAERFEQGGMARVQAMKESTTGGTHSTTGPSGAGLSCDMKLHNGHTPRAAAARGGMLVELSHNGYGDLVRRAVPLGR